MCSPDRLSDHPIVGALVLEIENSAYDNFMDNLFYHILRIQ